MNFEPNASSRLKKGIQQFVGDHVPQVRIMIKTRMNFISIDYMNEVQDVDVSYEAQSYVGGESPYEYETQIIKIK